MATAKTGSFYLTETVVLSGGTTTGGRVQGTIDLGAYVNVATGQAVAIESVDFIFQSGTTLAPNPEQMVTSSGTIGSGSLVIDQANNVASYASDLYPDNFGPTSLSEAFLVVNDSLYLVAGIDGATVTGANNLAVTARIKCRVAKLSSKDWMAIAIQSTASDN
ncbi:MAG: hypothetical protein ACXABD_21925 [Candidatus Thorarchaeota archaeon]